MRVDAYTSSGSKPIKANQYIGWNVICYGWMVCALVALPQDLQASCDITNSGNRIVSSGSGTTCQLPANASYNMSFGPAVPSIPRDGIYALNGAQVESTGTLTIDYQGGGGTSVSPVSSQDAGSLFTLENVNIHRTATSSEGNGIRAYRGGQITVNGNVYVYIDATQNATAIDAFGNGSVVNLYGDTITADFIGNSTNGGAIVSEQGSALLTSTGTITVRTEGTTAFLTDRTARMQLNDIVATVGVDINGDGVLKGGAHTVGAGVWAVENGIIEYNNANLTNNIGYGLHAQGNGRIVSSGLSSILSTKDNKGGALATGANATILLQDAEITVTGSNATGMLATERGKIQALDVTITGTTNAGIQGLVANANSNITLLGLLNAQTSSNGVHASGANATISLQEADITVTGTNATGILVENAGKVQAQKDVSITGTASAGIRGLVANAGSNITLQGLLNAQTTSHSVQALGPNATVSLGSANVETSQGIGMHAVDGGAIQINNSARVRTQAANMHGLWVQTSNSASPSQISVTGPVDIATQSAGAYGAYALGQNSLLRLDGGGTITTAGAQAYGLQAASGANVQGSGLLTVSTTGADATGILATQATATLGSVNVETSQAIGVHAVDGGAIQINNSARVRTQAANMHGLWVQTSNSASPSQISVTGPVDIATQSAGAYGAYALGQNSLLRLDGGGTITTAGAQAYGLQVAGGANVQGSGQLAIRTSGDGAAGIVATQATTPIGSTPQVRLGSVDIQTQGSNADGLQIGGWAKDNAGVESTTLVGAQVVIEDQLKINVLNAGTGAANSNGCGTGAAVCLTGDGASLNATTGNNSSLVSAGNVLLLALGEGMDVQLSNSLLQTTGSAALLQVLDNTTSLASSSVTLENSSADGRSSNWLIDVGENRALDFQALNSNLAGNVSAHASSTLDMNLNLGSTLYGSVQGAKNLTLSDANSNWYTPSNSTLGNLTNAGNITFVHTETGPQGIFKTITVDNYVGQDGYISLSTHLGDDNSPSDKLVITPTGTASGHTTLKVIKYSGLGAPTVGNGIQVVEAQGGSTATTLDAFSLYGTSIPGGAYEYTLERNANGSWYLVSKADGTVPPPQEPYAPVIRRELSLYSSAPSLTILQGAAVLDSLHERKGGAQNWGENAEATGPFWTRLIRTQGNIQPTHSATVTGNDFKYHINGIQLGFDLLHNYTLAGINHDAGLFVAYAGSSSTVKYKGHTKAGDNHLNSSSVGGYWTSHFENGAYVDLVGMLTHHKMSLSSTRLPHASSTGKSTALSIEAGIPFAASDKWMIEPQVQLRMQRGHLSDSADAAGLIKFGSIKSLESRIGVRAAHQSSDGTFWGRVDWLQEMQGKTSTSLSTVSGKHSAHAPADLHGGSLAFTAGLDKELGNNLSVYGSASYQHRFSGRGHGYGINAGIKFAW